MNGDLFALCLSIAVGFWALHQLVLGHWFRAAVLLVLTVYVVASRYLPTVRSDLPLLAVPSLWLDGSPHLVRYSIAAVFGIALTKWFIVDVFFRKKAVSLPVAAYFLVPPMLFIAGFNSLEGTRPQTLAFSRKNAGAPAPVDLSHVAWSATRCVPIFIRRASSLLEPTQVQVKRGDIIHVLRVVGKAVSPFGKIYGAEYYRVYQQFDRAGRPIGASEITPAHHPQPKDQRDYPRDSNVSRSRFPAPDTVAINAPVLLIGNKRPGFGLTSGTVITAPIDGEIVFTLQVPRPGWFEGMYPYAIDSEMEVEFRVGREVPQ